MDRPTALERIKRMTAWDMRPALTEADLNALLDQFRTVDAEGRLVGDSAWAGAYNLNAAAAEGWRWKAGRVAGDFSFSADGSRYDKAAVLENIAAMIRAYAAKDVGVASTGYGVTYDSPRLLVNS